MRITLILPLFIAWGLLSASAEDEARLSPFADLPPREAALEHLLSERESPEALEQAIAAARKEGIGDQAVLEARFLFHVDRGDDDALAAMAPEFIKRRDSLKIEDSEIFAVREDWLAVTEYVQAIAAIRAGDRDAFKKHITEAFWLSPKQGAAFAPHIDRLRLEDAMSAITMDFSSIELAPLAGGDAVSLAAVMEGKKALLIHFWSPWSRESEAGIPDFASVARDLLSKSFAVVSILPEQSEKVVGEAREIVAKLGEEHSGHWLLDRRQRPLNRDLRVQTIPVMILVSDQGRILFHGHPADEAFWSKLAAIDPAIIRPELSDSGDEP